MIPAQTPFQKGDKVVAYCRYSEGDEQGLKNTSTKEQAEAITEYCRVHGLELVKIFEDPFASGRSVSGRDHYLEMLSFLLHKKRTGIQGVILWDYERYGRNYDRAQYDAAQLRMKGYKIFSMQQPIIDNGPFSHVLEAMYFASAQNQSDMISADVKRALQNNFQKYKVIPRSCIPDGWIPVPVNMGVDTDGSPRIGYKAEPDPEYKDRIREAIEGRLNLGYRVSDMQTVIGGIFEKHYSKTKKLLSKPLLYGSFTYGGTTMEEYCEPIIDKEMFDRLQIYNEEVPHKARKEGAGAYSADRTLLSGLCYCGVCGERSYICRRKAKNRMYETYYCNHKHSGISREYLESFVLEKAKELLADEQYYKDREIILEQLKTPSGRKADVTAMKSEIGQINRKLDHLAEIILESEDMPETMLKKMKDLERKRDSLLKQIDDISSADPTDKIAEAADILRKSVLSVLESERSSTDDLRAALSVFIIAIVTYPDKNISIYYTLPGLSEVGGIKAQPAQLLTKNLLVVGSEPRVKISAPPEGTPLYAQLIPLGGLLLCLYSSASRRACTAALQ